MASQCQTKKYDLAKTFSSGTTPSNMLSIVKWQMCGPCGHVLTELQTCMNGSELFSGQTKSPHSRTFPKQIEACMAWSCLADWILPGDLCSACFDMVMLDVFRFDPEWEDQIRLKRKL